MEKNIHKSKKAISSQGVKRAPVRSEAYKKGRRAFWTGVGALAIGAGAGLTINNNDAPYEPGEDAELITVIAKPGDGPISIAKALNELAGIEVEDLSEEKLFNDSRAVAEISLRNDGIVTIHPGERIDAYKEDGQLRFPQTTFTTNR